ncbi:CDP-alcohol phosphatidyltransferase family protein [Nesterenkonia sp. PF2B19]|uniref:CDP-alcohol phosphatidyltransferase family protein n=1 Tax=Nesterenkonia sp. PF2B19 TaxID=1881858 RepID=UPI000872E84A|nr:CDP-alcohol phosphatidyltransferase family protein [Nesterenkonia sp. PF2B19]OSM44271.1 CDP-diacylglycerol--glycerol-3-phosphate 3-phosphatidyltransferase [Nesterenkonia sp. PF2B19]
MRFIGAGTREGFEYTLHETFWTVPNVVTVVRFLLLPVFVWLVATGSYLGAFWVLAVLSSTDWVDGYIARRFDQLSTVGQWLDPLADRLSLVIVTITLVVFSVAPLWVVLAVVIPDLVLFVHAAVRFSGSPQLTVSVLGKIRTACLLVGAPLILLGRTPQLEGTVLVITAELVLAAGCLMHILASIDYLVKAHRKARQLRSRGIRPRDRAQWARESGG